MIHQFVSKHIAEALRTHGLDLPGLLWVPHHDETGGDRCVAAEVGPNVRLLVRVASEGSIFAGDVDSFQLDDRTLSDENGALSRRWTETSSLVRHLRGWAAEATARHVKARDAYNLTVRRMDGLCRALDAIGHLAPESEGVDHEPSPG